MMMKVMSLRIAATCLLLSCTVGSAMQNSHAKGLFESTTLVNTYVRVPQGSHLPSWIRVLVGAPGKEHAEIARQTDGFVLYVSGDWVGPKKVEVRETQSPTEDPRVMLEEVTSNRLGSKKNYSLGRAIINSPPWYQTAKMIVDDPPGLVSPISATKPPIVTEDIEKLIDEVNNANPGPLAQSFAEPDSTGRNFEATNAEKSPLKLNNEGVAALKQNDFQLAIAKLSEALKLDPSYSLAKSNLAIVHNNLGLSYASKDLIAAIREFHKSMEISPSAITEKNINDAMKRLGKDPNSAADREALGDIERKQAEFAGAEYEYEKACSIKDSNALREKRGDIARVKDRNLAAVEHYQKAIGLKDTAALEVKLGTAFLATKNVGAANQSFRRAMALDPKDPDVLELLIVGLEESVAANASPENYLALGQAYFLIRDFKKAESQYKLAISCSPGKQNIAAVQFLKLLPGANLEGVDLLVQEQTPVDQAAKSKGGASGAVEASSNPPLTPDWMKLDNGLGKQYALFFATNTYTKGWPTLDNPLKDCHDIAAELEEHFGYEPAEVIEDPTEEQFSAAITQYINRKFEDNDQLFIYISGHGDFDVKRKKAYLVASDSDIKAQSGNRSSYISALDLLSDISSINCNRIFVCLDTCNSNDFFEFMRVSSSEPKEKGKTTSLPLGLTLPQRVKETSKYRTRKLLTSAAGTASDGKKGENSPFAFALLEALRTFGGSEGFLVLPQIETEVTKYTTGALGAFNQNQPGSQYFFVFKPKTNPSATVNK